MRTPHNKLPVERIINRCDELGLNYVNSEVKENRTYVFFTCPNHMDRGVQKSAWCHFKDAKRGCRFCTGRGKTTADLQKELDDKGVQVIIVGEYKTAHDKILYRCKLCGEVHEAIPNSLLNGQACPTCGTIRRGLRRRKDADTFRRELSTAQPNIEVIGEYHLSHSPIKVKCKIDGTEWESYPVNLLNMSAGCPTCQNRISKGELAVMSCLDSLKIEYKHEFVFNDCRRVHPLRFDFYIPSLNTAIEFDGKQHFEAIPYFDSTGSGFALTKERDSIKNKYCAENNIKIIRIPYFEISNIERIITDALELKSTA